MNPLVESQKAYILRCQLPSGTFRLGPERRQINPYFTNLALVPLVRLGAHEPVKQHVYWYLQHVNERGYVNDYRLENGRETDTGTADSEDSYHATLFSLLAEMLRHSGETDWLLPHRDTLAAIFRALIHLQQKDGLTWAKESYRVKYLMDNCEVLRGLEDAAFLFAQLGDSGTAAEARLRMEACLGGIGSMFSPVRGTYAVFDSHHPTWRKWYPDVTSQAFPIIYGVAPSDTAASLYEKISSSFPAFDMFHTGDFYPWMIMGECAWLMGDRERVDRMLQAAAELYIYGPRQPYWLIHEAGRFIGLLLRTETTE
jgi:hypothetical protein